MPDPLHPGERFDDPDHPLPWTRRAFLQKSAMAVAGGVLFSCTHNGSVIPTVSDTVSTSIDTRWPIKRVIYLMLENRSFNNLLGKLPGVVGSSVGEKLGKEVRLNPCPEYLPGDLPHDLAAHLNDWAAGKQDGFGGGAWGDPWAYTIHDEQQLPNYWLWAKEYAISDHFFSSAAGPSYPNHFYFIAGQSGGTIDNPENIRTSTLEDGSTFKSWGCDAVGDDVFVFVKDGQGDLTKHNTCFTFRTVGEQLDEVDVSWAYYAAMPGQPGYFWNAYNGIHDVFHDSAYWNAHMRPVDRLLRDIRSGVLPAVTWITPRFQLSDHPPYSSAWAHNWVTDIVTEVMRSDQWEHTAIFVTWDEWGGFYDPVPPPAVDDIGLGFRVPLLTISPYASRGLVDDEIGEFSTPLRFISDNWGLVPLTPRIRKAHNMEHLFDFTRGPRPPVLATTKADTYLESPYQNPGVGYPGWPPGTMPQDFIP
ncbi:MAG TPA: alkaline phosphatase family protein [Actinomycetota bacterium]|nr:alkaline phosphatase family protein [Actinomycetota bacterium]